MAESERSEAQSGDAPRKYLMNRHERRFVEAMSRKIGRGTKLNDLQAAALERLERLGAKV
jgi:hypothetical protein